MRGRARTVGIAVVALLAGAAAGWFLRPTETAEEASAAAEAPDRKVRAPKASGDEAALNRLRHRVQELEKKLAAARRAAAERPVVTNFAARAEEGRGRHGPPRPPTAEELEKMRVEDPQQYAQHTNRMARMAQFHRRRLERTANRLETLASIDTSHMTKREKANHARLQELLAKREELFEAMGNPENREQETEEQRRARGREMGELHRELRTVAEAERDTLLAETARELGLTGDDASAVVDTVKSIYEATSTGGDGPHHGPPPGGGRP